MAVPPIAAVLVGLILAAMIMGAVTIQVVAYMRRYSSDHKVTAVIVNVVFLWNAICLSLLGNALHHDLVTQFGKGRLHDHTLPQ
ncbi:hypothetical protein DL93DRAFT_498183 [Clavulina sp. PMI_390]|nr:hypothetical protein DL93DRAFT_498183 [Clavulina sp. PMI_390]